MVSRSLGLLLVPALLVLAAACGGDSTSTPSGTTTTTATASGSPTGTPTAGETATSTASETATSTEGTPSETGTVVETSTVTPEETSTEPVDAADGGCTVSVSGGETLEYQGPGGASAVGTDYWYTDDEMREILRQVASIGSDLTDEEIEEQVELDMMNDPRFILLLLNCVAEDGSGSISFTPSAPSKYADVPFEAKQYVIKAGEGIFGSSDVPGEFSILMTLGTASYKVATDGVLDITKFDNSGITGTFEFGGAEVFPEDGTTAKVITVDGSFDFECTGPTVCD